MAAKPRPDQTIRKCKHCGWTYIESCNCQPKPRPRRRPTDTERLDALLRWMRDAPGATAMVIRTRRDIDKLLREEGRRAK